MKILILCLLLLCFASPVIAEECVGANCGTPEETGGGGSVPVTGTVVINNGITLTNSTSVTLTLSSPTATHMRFSKDGGTTWVTGWEQFAVTRSVILLSNGSITVQFRDLGGVVSGPITDTILIDSNAIPTGPRLKHIMWPPSPDSRVIGYAISCSDMYYPFSAVIPADVGELRDVTLGFAQDTLYKCSILGYQSVAGATTYREGSSVFVYNVVTETQATTVEEMFIPINNGTNCTPNIDCGTTVNATGGTTPVTLTINSLIIK